MRANGTDEATVETSYFDDNGTTALDASYATADGPHWVARRHPSGRISWRLFVREPEQAAS